VYVLLVAMEGRGECRSLGRFMSEEMSEMRKEKVMGNVWLDFPESPQPERVKHHCQRVGPDAGA